MSLKSIDSMPLNSCVKPILSGRARNNSRESKVSTAKILGPRQRRSRVTTEADALKSTAKLYARFAHPNFNISTANTNYIRMVEEEFKYRNELRENLLLLVLSVIYLTKVVGIVVRSLRNQNETNQGNKCDAKHEIQTNILDLNL